MLETIFYFISTPLITSTSSWKLTDVLWIGSSVVSERVKGTDFYLGLDCLKPLDQSLPSSNIKNTSLTTLLWQLSRTTWIGVGHNHRQNIHYLFLSLIGCLDPVESWTIITFQELQHNYIYNLNLYKVFISTKGSQRSARCSLNKDA